MSTNLDNIKKTGKELMSQDEIAVMDGSKCIMQLRGVRPFFSDKFDITKHKQYPLLSDYDKKNEFDIEKYIKNRNRLRFKRNDVVDEVAMSEKSLPQCQVMNSIKVKIKEQHNVILYFLSFLTR